MLYNKYLIVYILLINILLIDIFRVLNLNAPMYTCLENNNN